MINLYNVNITEMSVVGYSLLKTLFNNYCIISVFEKTASLSGRRYAENCFLIKIKDQTNMLERYNYYDGIVSKWYQVFRYKNLYHLFK